MSLFVFAAAAGAAGPTAELGRRLMEAGLDPEECYRVRELSLVRDDVKLYFTEGHLTFSKAVNGVRPFAVFSGDVDGGDAELLIMPPNRSERLSLANFAGSPNLSEHFRMAVFVFSDNTYVEVMKALRARGEPRKSPENGVLIAERMATLTRNFASSFQVRLVRDLLSEAGPARGFFYGAISGERLGNFDMFYDPTAAEQVAVGQVVSRENRSYFNVWTRFVGRSFRGQTRAAAAPPGVALSNYRIDATLQPDLNLKVITRVSVTPSVEGRRVLAFDISPQMKVTSARIGGVESEVFQPESLRASLIRGDINDTFLVIPPRPLEAGHEYEMEFRHEGQVISQAGNGVFYVGSRGSWYPNRDVQFARFELTFRHPRDLDLVATGKVVEEALDGDFRVARHRTDAPVRMAGFNLGHYERKTVNRGGYTIEVYANRRVEPVLQPRPPRVIVLPPTASQRSPRWTVDLHPFPIDIPAHEPPPRLEQLADEIAGGLEFMASHFGPPVLRLLTVSPIPGTFGQGFPGLIYLSTLAYLDPSQRPPGARSESQQTFYSEILQAHETAHQWWGNVVTAMDDEDNWIMEALANYTALLYLERRKGSRALESVMAEYKGRLLAKDTNGHAVESAGPIAWGLRLISSQSPNAWRTITYEKGSWIVHMLRRRMGDERFLSMLATLRKRYQYRGINTEQFRRAAAEALPAKSPDPQLEGFFEQWVYTTGIPSLKLNYSVKGKAPAVRLTGTITQGDVDEDFSALVPVEIQVPRGKPVVEWVRTASEPVSFTVNLRQAPGKVSLDPANSVLRK